MADRTRVPEDAILVGLYGGGGFGREAMPLLRETVRNAWSADDQARILVCFIETTPVRGVINATPVLSEEEFFTIPASARHFNVAVGSPGLRRELAERCIARGGRPLSIRSAQSAVYDENVIGEGLVMTAFSAITSNAVVGRFFQCQLSSYVSHDCVIGDFVTFAPHAKCNGNVHVGDLAYIGAGAVIKQGTPARPLTIGAGAIVGMGAVVTRDVAPGETVVGNPARPLVRGR